jgi:hypothetical protein
MIRTLEAPDNRWNPRTDSLYFRLGVTLGVIDAARARWRDATANDPSQRYPRLGARIVNDPVILRLFPAGIATTARS